MKQPKNFFCSSYFPNEIKVQFYNFKISRLVLAVACLASQFYVSLNASFIKKFIAYCPRLSLPFNSYQSEFSLNSEGIPSTNLI